MAWEAIKDLVRYFFERFKTQVEASAAVMQVAVEPASNVTFAANANAKTDYIDGDASPVVIPIVDGNSTLSAALTAGYWHVWASLGVYIQAGSAAPTATSSSHPVGAEERVGIWINDAGDKIAALRQGSDTGSVWLSKAKSNA